MRLAPCIFVVLTKPAASWIWVRVSLVLDSPQQHHGVVFMDGVVAVHGPVAAKIAEAGEELNLFAELEATHVLPGHFYC